MSEGVETYLGGFYFPFGVSIGHVGLGLTAKQANIGAGVYATSRRLFIIGPGKGAFPSGLNKIVPGSGKREISFLPH